MLFKESKQSFSNHYFLCRLTKRQINWRRQQKTDKILDLKSTCKFIESRESERINRFDITACVQSNVNLRIYQKVCKMCFMNKDKFNKKIYKFAKKVIIDFVTLVPQISLNKITLERETKFVKVGILSV